MMKYMENGIANEDGSSVTSSEVPRETVKAMGWCTAWCEMLPFHAKTIFKKVTQF